jgi:hypothetical protein
MDIRREPGHDADAGGDAGGDDDTEDDPVLLGAKAPGDR